jgi:hypothetical protein
MRARNCRDAACARLLAPCVVLITAALAVSGCAHLPGHKQPAPVTAEPVAAAAADTAAAPVDTTAADTTKTQHPLGLPATNPAHTEKKENGHEDARETGPTQVNPPTQVEAVMSPAEAKQARDRAAADTVLVAQALKKCSGRQLLPDQESVYDTVRSLLSQTRGALQSGELWRAESLARKARQLASSLSCP